MENGVERISRVEYEHVLFCAQPKLNAGGAYWHNGLCIQIMEALCHIYGFAYCHLITVLPKNYENFVLWEIPR